MPFANINTFYIPYAANAGASQWGTNVRKLTDVAPAPVLAEATTITNHSTGGVVVRTFSPYATMATDDVQANFGWAITPTDMGGAAGALRFYPAGNHIASIYFAHSGALAENGTLFMYVYRVGNAAGGRVRTLLGSGSATVVLPVNSGSVYTSCTTALPEIIFAVDETIQYSFELSLAGVAVVGHTATLYTGDPGLPAKLVTPTLKVLADTTGVATGLGLASGSSSTVLGTIGTGTGLGLATATGSSISTTTGTATGIGTAVGFVSSVAGAVGAATGLGLANGLTSRVLGTVGEVTIGAAGGGGTIIVKKVIAVIFDD